VLTCSYRCQYVRNRCVFCYSVSYFLPSYFVSFLVFIDSTMKHLSWFWKHLHKFVYWTEKNLKLYIIHFYIYYLLFLFLYNPLDSCLQEIWHPQRGHNTTLLSYFMNKYYIYRYLCVCVCVCVCYYCAYIILIYEEILHLI